MAALPEEREVHQEHDRKKEENKFGTGENHSINPSSCVTEVLPASGRRARDKRNAGAGRAAPAKAPVYFLASYFLISLMLYHSMLLSLLEEYPPGLYHFWFLK